MMKKMLIACLVLMMLCTTAMAATWPEGLSAQKPYSGTPEVDFQKSFGYMIMVPRKDSTVIPGTDTLSVCTPRVDVAIGTGEFVLYNRTTGKKEVISMDDERVTMREMSDTELDAMLWGSGTIFDIRIEKGLEPNCEYYIEMSEGCFISPEYEAVSPEIKGRDKWAFNTRTKNVVEKLKYYRENENKQTTIKVEEVQVGDSAKFSVKMDENVAVAAVYFETGLIEAEVTWFTENTEVSVSFPQAGSVKWGIAFMDSEGNLVGKAVFMTEVAPLAE